MMKFRAAFLVFVVVAMPLVAQTVEIEPSVRETDKPAQTVPEDDVPSEAAKPQRKLRLVTEATTQNYIAKFDSAGAVTDSGIFESSSGFIGIGTSIPANALHVKITDGAINAPLKVETSGADSISGISVRNDARNWLLRVDGADGDRFKIHDASAGLNRFTIDTFGRVGINTSSPQVDLHVYAPSDAIFGIGPDPNGVTGSALNIGYAATAYGAGAGFINVRSHSSLTGPINPSLRLSTDNQVRMIVTRTGAIGIGTEAPAERLHVVTDVAGPTVAEFYNPSTLSGAYAGMRARSSLAATTFVAHGPRDPSLMRYGIAVSGWSEILNYNGNGQIIGTILATPLVFGTNNVERVRVLSNGNVGIGTTAPAAKLHVMGDVVVNGNITGAKVIGAVYQDLAEWVPATSDMAPGTVVVLNVDKTNEVMASSRSYDTTVAGVVSAAPGIILGIGDDTKEQIATTGRVKVRVDARTTPVRVGDLLVTSDVPGTAMKSQPMEINGRQFHQPGTIIGKALEPLPDGVGEILVLLSMQ